MSSPTASIILPAFRRPQVLKIAIESIRYQTMSDFELLVVGDGCGEPTRRLIESIDDDRIHYLDMEKAPGFGYANRNEALRRATGDVIAYMSHDDIWLPDHLELAIGRLTEPETDFVYSRLVSVDGEGNMWPSTFNLESPLAKSRFDSEPVNMSIGNVVHDRACIAKYGIWDESGRAGGDQRLWRRYLQGGRMARFGFVSEPTLLHFVADWRRQREWWRPSLIDTVRSSGAHDFLLPDVLRIEVPPGVLEQQAVWKAISADPESWTRDFRRAVTAVLDGRLILSNDLVPMVIGGATRKVTDKIRSFVRDSSAKRAGKIARDNYRSLSGVED